MHKKKKVHTMCRIAISRDFLDMLLPNPLLSVEVDNDLTDLRDPNSDIGFRGSDISATCPLECTRLLPGVSVTLPLVTMGDECRLGALAGTVVSGLLFVTEAPGRDLPAESGLSGKVVLRFGGVSRGKSGGTTGCCGDRIRGPGELGRDDGAEARPFEAVRPLELR